MLDALLATIGTLGILASLACKLRSGADMNGTEDMEDVTRSGTRQTLSCCRRQRRRQRR